MIKVVTRSIKKVEEEQTISDQIRCPGNEKGYVLMEMDVVGNY